MNIRDYLDTDLLAQRINEGYVRRMIDGPHVIYNYTPKAQYEHMWDDITRKCRGLIVDLNTGRVLARPFPKFFNWGEVDRDMVPDGPIRVTEKVDGSLGILWEDKYSRTLRVASRGSLTSEQALHATEVLHKRYEDFKPYAGYTYLFEIIYPENRIVVDYGAMDDLVLLDILNEDTGVSVLDTDLNTWPGPVVEHHEFTSLEDVVQSQRVNAEGFVVLFEKDQSRVKVKHDEYVRLHRLVTGVSNKSIWEMLSTGKNLEDILDHVPDEFYNWVRKVDNDLQSEYSRIQAASWSAFRHAMKQVHEDFGSREHRKAFAEYIAGSEYQALYWRYYDDKPVDDVLWKLIKPEYSRPFWNQTEEAA